MNGTLPRHDSASATRVRLTDSTLRDGSHAMAHQFTEEQVRTTVHALDAAGVFHGHGRCQFGNILLAHPPAQQQGAPFENMLVLKTPPSAGP